MNNILFFNIKKNQTEFISLWMNWTSPLNSLSKVKNDFGS